MSVERLPVPYEVGYGKPPAEHRFEKGRSGNPKGRPKRAKPKPKTVDTGFGMKAAEEFLRIEAYRPVTIREGEQVLELPAIQAVFRAMGVAAMKGNRFVQKTLAEMVAKMEAEHHAAKFELFGTMVEYKHNWDQEIERCRKAGLPQSISLLLFSLLFCLFASSQGSPSMASIDERRNSTCGQHRLDRSDGLEPRENVAGMPLLEPVDRQTEQPAGDI